MKTVTKDKKIFLNFYNDGHALKFVRLFAKMNPDMECFLACHRDRKCGYWELMGPGAFYRISKGTAERVSAASIWPEIHGGRTFPSYSAAYDALSENWEGMEVEHEDLYPDTGRNGGRNEAPRRGTFQAEG